MTPKLITNSKLSEYVYEEFLTIGLDKLSYNLCASYLVFKEPNFMMEYYPELYLKFIGKIKKESK